MNAADIGSAALWGALALASYAAVGSVLGVLQRRPPLVESARYAAYLTVPLLGIAVANLVGAFLTHDFQIAYVFDHSNTAMPRAYTWVAFYAGNQGSLLFVAFVMASFSSLAVWRSRHSASPSLAYSTAVMMGVLTFFTAVLIVLANPFELLPSAPLGGRGINPLLTHPGMFLHPPALMTGLTAVTVPFAFAMGHLLARPGADQNEWLEPARTWAMVSWALLGAGNLLGAWWAYTILGWGGYWGWDPVENAGFMPWLAMTAFVHSLVVQKQRRMFHRWTMSLIIIAFALANFGVFINRGGPVPSVHSFGASTLGWVFLLFLGISIVASLLLFFLRYPSLGNAQRMESTLSREGAFLVNNMLLLAITFVTFWGEIYPLISDAFTGTTVTVGAPFYNQVNGPLMLALILTMGVGPLLPWRRASMANLTRTLMVPGLVAVLVVSALALLGVRNVYALLSFALISTVAAGIIGEWTRGTRSRHRRGESYPAAFLRLIAANRRRYGGYIVHLAILLLALGITGSRFYGIQRDVALAPGEQATIGNYQVQFVGATSLTYPDRLERVATLRASNGGSDLGTLTAWRAFYPAFNMASTRAAIRSTPLEDLYIIFGQEQESGGATFRLMVNPLVWWLWLAGPIFILGTLVALWPQRLRPPGHIARLQRERVATPSSAMERQE